MKNFTNPAPWVPGEDKEKATNKFASLVSVRALWIAIAILVIGACVGAGIAYGVTRNMQADAAEVQKRVSLDKAYQEKSSKYKDLSNEYTDLSNEYDNAVSVIRDADEISSKMDEVQDQYDSLQTKTKKMQGKYDALTKKYDTAKGKPISLPAGTYTVGDQIPAGRYVISGSSNFYTSDGEINTILGNSSVGMGDYHGDLVEGTVVQNSAPATLTPVK